MLRSIAALLSLALCSACGGSATAKLKLRNDTSASAARPGAKGAAAAPSFAAQAPTMLGMKLIAAYVVENVDPQTQNNVGEVSMIWMTPECEGDINTCNVTGAPKGPWLHEVKHYFDFAQGTAAVNAALNSQGLPIKPGTYRFARLEFCKYGSGDQPNVQWSAPGVPSTRAFISGECGVTSKQFAEPVTVKAGDAIAVTLAYDLVQAGAVGTQTYGSGCFGTSMADAKCYEDCYDGAGGVRTCVNVPIFEPSASFTFSSDAGTSP